ncbi:ComF family protein (Fragment) OS=Streptomyces microflavus OX=1919 GN=G3I39_01110 PE=4 SV=1 [Streptomyces microflavus]
MISCAAIKAGAAGYLLKEDLRRSGRRRPGSLPVLRQRRAVADQSGLGAAGLRAGFKSIDPGRRTRRRARPAAPRPTGGELEVLKLVDDRYERPGSTLAEAVWAVTEALA